MRLRYLVFTLTIFLLLVPNNVQAALKEWTKEDLKKLENGSLAAGAALFGSDINIDDTSTLLPPLPVEKTIPLRPIVIHPTPDITKHLDTSPAPDGRIPLSSKLISRYFDKKIEEGIIDPQRLLSLKEGLDVQQALKHYAEESPVSIYFYLFDANQLVPDSHSSETVFNNFYYSEPSAVVVYYFIGEPERCQVYFGGKDANLIATNKIRDLVSGIRMGAKKRSNKISQLDEFIRQLSLHMYWIEKAMIVDVYTPLEPEKSVTSSSANNGISDKVYVGLNRLSQYWWMITLGSAGIIALLLGGVYWVKSRKFHFPHLAIKPRLTLPNGGSSGGILAYDDEHTPPSAQRKQFHNPFK